MHAGQINPRWRLRISVESGASGAKGLALDAGQDTDPDWQPI